MVLRTHDWNWLERIAASRELLKAKFIPPEHNYTPQKELEQIMMRLKKVLHPLPKEWVELFVDLDDELADDKSRVSKELKDLRDKYAESQQVVVQRNGKNESVTSDQFDLNALQFPLICKIINKSMAWVNRQPRGDRWWGFVRDEAIPELKREIADELGLPRTFFEKRTHPDGTPRKKKRTYPSSRTKSFQQREQNRELPPAQAAHCSEFRQTIDLWLTTLEKKMDLLDDEIDALNQETDYPVEDRAKEKKERERKAIEEIYEIFWQHHFKEENFRDIGYCLGISDSTARRRWDEAKNQLKHFIQSQSNRLK